MGEALQFDLAQATPARRWMALCEGCRHCLSDEEYTQAEAAAGPNGDPACPGCGRRAWTFWPED